MTPQGDRATGRGRAALPWGVILWLTAVVLWATYAPFLPRHEPWHLTLAPPTSRLEVVGNFLLFAPLAFVLGRRVAGRSAGRRALAGLGLGLAGACALVEGGQTLVDGRIVSPYDFLLNLGGAVFGLGVAGAAVAASAQTRRVLYTLFGVSLLMVYAGLVVFLIGRVPTAREGLKLYDWDPVYEVRVGDEIGGGRSYQGEVTAAAICAGTSGDSLCATGGIGAGDRQALARMAERTQSVQLQARVRSSSSDQYGPTRIITFSDGVSRRNATLGQSGDDLVLRLRTPVGGPNGANFLFRLRGGLPLDQVLPVTGVYREGTVQLRTGSGPKARSETFSVTPEWLAAWLILTRVDEGYPAQLRWAAAAWLVLVVGPFAWGIGWVASGWSTASQVMASIGTCGLIACVVSLVLTGTVQPMWTVASSAAAVVTPIGARDGRLLYLHYTA